MTKRRGHADFDYSYRKSSRKGEDENCQWEEVIETIDVLFAFSE
jgi:hypothetical protein